MMLARIAPLSGALIPKNLGYLGFKELGASSLSPISQQNRGVGGQQLLGAQGALTGCFNPASLQQWPRSHVGVGSSRARNLGDDCGSGLAVQPRGPYCYPKLLTGTEHRAASPCRILTDPEEKPCFDISLVSVEAAEMCHASMMRSFLYSHYWPREPLVTSLWMNLRSQYIHHMTERFSNLGDRFIAFERIPRTGEKRMIGMLYADKVFPRTCVELQEWAATTVCRNDRLHMLFMCHLQRAPQLFKKYHPPYIYNIEVLVTSPEVQCQGVGTMLMDHALKHAVFSRHLVTMCPAVSAYTDKICRRLGMKREWSMQYADFIDEGGHRVFYPRRPHLQVTVYSQRLTK